MVSPVSRLSLSAQHLRRAAPAEIGLEQCRQRRARDKDRQRCCGEPRRLTQQGRFILRQRPGGGPAEQRIVGRRAGDVLLHRRGAEPDEPVATEIALPGPGELQRPEAQRLDHHAGLRPP